MGCEEVAFEPVPAVDVVGVTSVVALDTVVPWLVDFPVDLCVVVP